MTTTATLPIGHPEGPQSYTRDELEAYVWRRFKERLGQYYETNPFHRDRLKKAGATPEMIQTRDDLKRIPLTSKPDLVADSQDAPPFGRRLGVDPTEVVRIAMSGGTTGLGRTIQPNTEADLVAANLLLAQALRWAGQLPKDIFVFNVPITNHQGGWFFNNGGTVNGRVPYLIGHESFGERLELMKTFGVNGMFAAPSGLNGLTLLCHQQGVKPRELFPDLRFLLSGGEAYPPEFAERIEDEWGVKFFEGYGSTESGGETASACEVGAVVDGRRGLLHLYEESWLFEVLDLETGEHVKPGEAGRLVFTNLDKQASPMLRHDSGDRVTWLPHTACTCGRSYSGLEAGTIGRIDDMLKIKGTNIWPAEIDSVMFSFPTVAEYQGQVFIGGKGRDEASITVEFRTDEADAAVRVKEITAELKRKLEVRFDVIPSAEPLPRAATSDKKARRWVDNRAEALASGHTGQ